MWQRSPGARGADEVWAPDRPETVPIAHRRDAIEQRVDEEHASLGVDADIVNVQIAGRVRRLRQVEAVVTFGLLVLAQDILELPKLVQRADEQTVVGAMNGARLVKAALENRQRAVLVEADEVELADLGRGKNQTGVRLIQPFREPARTADVER